ncbi:sigma-54-dependent transcriptional regulator [Myxococcota bacterium]
MTAEARTILVVDDDPAIGRVLAALLQQDGLDCRQAENATKALRVLQTEPIDVVVSDIKMPGKSGMELLPEIHEVWPGLPVIMLTAHGSVPTAVEAMRLGAADFILKPFDRQEILFVIRKALATTENAAHDGITTFGEDTTVIGSSKGMQDVLAMVDKVGPTDSTVLLRGESGTGKEVVARALHARSKRNTGPFVAIRCAAIPDNLLESELFGYEKGAFTGATCRKPGRIELAQGGTVFLDEIGDLSATMQAKLLHVLQERQLDRLGGTQTVNVNVRFLAATHQDLDAMVASKDFREDLFYRLNVVPIVLPPLRDRGADIGMLAKHFFSEIVTGSNKADWVLDTEALSSLRREAWPGNVRQLQNLVERLVILSDGPNVGAPDVRREIERDMQTQHPTEPSTHTPKPDVAPRADAQTLGEQQLAGERRVLEETLARCDNNRAKAARVLGVSRRTLYNKLQKHGLV